MSADAIAALFFIFILSIFLYKRRSRVEVQKVLFPILYVVMYRSDAGLSAMKSFSRRFPRLCVVLGDIGTVAGFIGMFAICVQLIWSTIDLLINKGAPAIQPVLPIEAKGVFFIPFIYWALSIFLLAVAHEFAHGLLSNTHGIPVKSSGFAFLCAFIPILPAAFVEPEERVLMRKTARQQFAVFAAGPFANMLFAALALGLLFLISPALSAAFEQHGIEVFEASGPALSAGLAKDDVILALNSVNISSPLNVSSIINASRPGDTLLVQTENRTLSVTLGKNEKNESLAFMGVRAVPHMRPRAEFISRYGRYTPAVLQWFGGLFLVLFALNIGIGLFNLLPIGPLDGGRMFQLVCVRLFGKKGLRVWSTVGLFFVGLILLNLIVGLVR